VEFARKLLEEIGLEGQRLQMINISSAMAGQFAFAAAEMTAEIERIGPNPIRMNGTEKSSEKDTEAGQASSTVRDANPD
jgi:F420-non-reducing hydrogenase iron-sulfur subunit